MAIGQPLATNAWTTAQGAFNTNYEHESVGLVIIAVVLFDISDYLCSGCSSKCLQAHQYQL